METCSKLNIISISLLTMTCFTSINEEVVMLQVDVDEKVARYLIMHFIA